MRSRTTKRFREAFEELPEDVKERTRKAFKIWKKDSSYPGLKFKLIHSDERIYSVRIGIGWRALCLRQGDVMIWFWIGSHAEYDKLVSHLKKS